MTDLLAALFSALTPLWEMSITAAFAAVIVVLLRMVLKKHAPRQVVCLLWLIVFARLLIPLSLESPVSVVPSALADQPAAVTQAPADLPVLESSPVLDQTPSAVGHPSAVGQTPIQSVQDPVVLTPGTFPVTAGDPQPANEPAVEDQPAAVKENSFSWRALAAGVWLAGFAAMLAYALISYVALRRRVFAAILAPDGAWEHPHVYSPFILGFFRPKVYLPAGYAVSARQLILCHERAHLRRRDYIVKPICWLALAIHWFNPMAWVSYLLLSRDIEVACDQAVIRQMGASVKADYSSALLALATNGRFPTPSPLAFGLGDVSARIRSVLSYKKPTVRTMVAAVLAVAAAAACLLTDPAASSAKHPNDDPGSAASTPLALDGYDSYDWYPGLYFQTDSDPATGTITYRAYKLEQGEPALLGGWVSYPANNFTGVIDSDGTETLVWDNPFLVAATYTQLLVNTCLELNPAWADTLPTQRSAPYEDGFMYLAQTEGITLYRCPASFFSISLIRYGNTLQAIPCQFLGSLGDSPTLIWSDLDNDSQKELTVIIESASTGTHCDVDGLAVCEWDGARWTCFQYDPSAALTQLRESLTFRETSGGLTVQALGLSAEVPASEYSDLTGQWDNHGVRTVDYSYFTQFTYAGGGLQLRFLLSASPQEGEVLPLCTDILNFRYDLQYLGSGQFTEVPGGLESYSFGSGSQNDALSAYRTVLEGGAFTGAGGDTSELTPGQQYTLDQVYPGANLIPERFTVVDLDQDGTSEIVFLYSIGNGGTYLILRYEDGAVYGYTIYGRAFMGLKTDGTVGFSNSAASGGYACLHFTASSYTYEILADSDGWNERYYEVGHAEATAAEFEAFQKQQDSKTDAVWYNFTDSNIQNLLGML